MIETTEYIPINHINSFYETLRACGGSFKRNPIYMQHSVIVVYSYIDNEGKNKHDNMYMSLTTQIRETVRKKSLWQKIKSFIW